jgi:hypothetical protein
VGERERRDDLDHAPEAARHRQKRKKKQQVIVTGQDMLDAELDEIEPAGGERTIDVDAFLARSLAEHHLPFAAAGADIGERLIVLAEKRVPVVTDRQAAVLGIAGKVHLNGGAGLVGASPADSYPSRLAGRTVEIGPDAMPCLPCHGLGRAAVAIRCRRQQRR